MKKNIGDAFNLLNREIKQLTPKKLYKQGYLTLGQVRYYYGYKKIHKEFPFEFIRVRTDEGFAGVFHVLFFGEYIPIEWLRDTWYRITGSSYEVDIRQCRDGVYDSKKLSIYCVNQYVAGQDKYVKFYTSSDWICSNWKSLFNYIGMYRFPIDVKYHFFVKTLKMCSKPHHFLGIEEYDLNT